MIHPDTLDEFLDIPRDSFAWVKKLSEEDLDDELDKLGFTVARPEKPLKIHQKACALLALAFKQFGFWLDMGTGKTRLMLEVLRHFFLNGEMSQALILVPSEEGVWSWERQIKQWKIDLPYVCIANESTNDKWDKLIEFDYGLIICSYPSLLHMLSKRQEVKPKRGKKSKQKIKLVADEKVILRFASSLGAIVCDESTKLGNQSSEIYKRCKKLSHLVEGRYMLAGRPFGKDPILVWSQQYLIDHGESLGDTLGLFRQVFYKEKKGDWSTEYTFNEKRRGMLADFMQHRGVTYDISECTSLPPVTWIKEQVRLPEDIQAYFDKAAAVMRQARGDYQLIRNTFIRMRQLSSGFVGFKDDETGERAQVVFPFNPKLERMLDRIDDMPLDRKFVVFYEYTHSGRTITEALRKRGYNVEWLWSGTEKEARRTVQERFETKRSLQGLVINWRLGSMVLNLQAANYMFVYESPTSVIDREQMERRCFREGQTLPGFGYDMIVRGTMDQYILDWHREGDDFFKAVLRDPYGILTKDRLQSAA